MRRNTILTISFLLFVSCSLMPDKPKLTSPVPEKIHKDAYVDASEVETFSTTAWQQFFQIKDFQSLISVSLKSNRDYLVSILEVDELKARYGIEESGYFPTLDITGTGVRQKIPANALGNGGLFGGNNAPAFIQSQYSANLGITAYELDFFGKVKNLKRSALQEFFAGQFAQDSKKISLIANVAVSYMEYLSDRELARLIEQTTTLQENVLDIIKKRLKAKVISEIEMQQATTLYQSLKADYEEQLRKVQTDWNDLNVMVGSNISKREFDTTFSQAMELIVKVPKNIDSQVLLMRPDIQEAESRIHAANARVGVARAAFFPSISLTTSAGFLSADIDNLFDGDSQRWNFSPRINLPIFTAGRNRDVLDIAKIRKKKTILLYEQAIQNAFREASNALISHERLDRQIQAQQKVVKAAMRATKLSELRYESGIESYLLTLDSRRSLYEAQRKLIVLQKVFFNNYVYLYKALGGGLKGIEADKS